MVSALIQACVGGDSAIVIMSAAAAVHHRLTQVAGIKSAVDICTGTVSRRSICC
jgi:hypothetical protein